MKYIAIALILITGLIGIICPVAMMNDPMVMHQGCDTHNAYAMHISMFLKFTTGILSTFVASLILSFFIYRIFDHIKYLLFVHENFIVVGAAPPPYNFNLLDIFKWMAYKYHAPPIFVSI